MEAVGAFLDQEWESINRLLSTGEHVNGFSFGTSPTFWPISGEATINFGPIDESLSQLIPKCDAFSTNLDHYFSQESSNSSSNDNIFIPTNHPSLENQHYGDPNHFHEPNYTRESTYLYSTATVTGEKTAVPLFSDNAIQEVQCEKEEERSDNLENEGRTRCERLSPLLGMGKGDKCEAPKKRARASGDAPKGKKNVTSKKNQKRMISLNEDEYINASINGSGCCSSEDSIVSQELNGEETSESKSISALNSDGKTTGGRGAATDPQSLYARKRRERINERLRILQSLVPNGTKVDISTMLEEAVQYVKFLQLQIKILGSDDLWMYAPIAYNGMDMGLYQKIHHLNNAGSSCL